MMVNDHGLFKLAYCRSLAFTRNLCTEHECCKNTHRVVLLWCKLVSTCKFRSSSYYLSWVESWSKFLPLRNSIFLFRDEINGDQKAKNGVLDLSFPPSKVLPTCCTSFFTTKNCEKGTRRAVMYNRTVYINITYVRRVLLNFCICPINQPPDKNV